MIVAHNYQIPEIQDLAEVVLDFAARGAPGDRAGRARDLRCALHGRNGRP